MAGFILMYELEDNWSVGYELYYTGRQFDNSFDQNRTIGQWVYGDETL